MIVQHAIRSAATASCLIAALIFSSCEDRKAQRIVDAAIEAHGGNNYRSFHLEFDFRDRHYTAARDGGIYAYTREFRDSTGDIRDVLNNEGFTRYRNGSAVSLPAEREAAFTRSVNSVIYFALLPFGLNDKAVNKEWLEETLVEGKPYDVVRVTFDPMGGGEDHQDIFLYWIHQEAHTMDYLAYAYETDGGGLRFRKAVNPREVRGIRFQDYLNYKPADETVALESLQKRFTSDSLELLSEVRLRNVQVTDYLQPD